MSETVSKTIKEHSLNDRERLAGQYRELYDLLDSLGITRENKETIGELVEKIAYYSERQAVQRSVEKVNDVLTSLYWNTRPTFSVNYWQHEQVKKHEVSLKA